MENKGSIVIDEKIYPVKDIRLAVGGIIVTAFPPKPMEGLKRGTYAITLFGGDGQFVYSDIAILEIPAVYDNVDIELYLTIDTVNGRVNDRKMLNKYMEKK
jgi:hypothetical protein